MTSGNNCCTILRVRTLKCSDPQNLPIVIDSTTCFQKLNEKIRLNITLHIDIISDIEHLGQINMDPMDKSEGRQNDE